MTLTARFKTFVCAVKVCLNLDTSPPSLVQASFFQFFLMPSFHFRAPSWPQLGSRMEYFLTNSSRCVMTPRQATIALATTTNVSSSAGNRGLSGPGSPGRLRASSFRDSLTEKRRLCTSLNSAGADLAPEEKALATL